MFTESEKVLLKKLSVTREWSLVEKVAQGLINDIKERNKLASTEWETLNNVIGDEREISGIRTLVQAVHLIAKQSK